MTTVQQPELPIAGSKPEPVKEQPKPRAKAKTAPAKPAPQPKQSTAVVQRVEPTPPVQTERQQLLGMLGSVLHDPNVPAEKLEVTWRVYREMIVDDRRIAFQEARTRMQREMPVINKRGRIEIYPKGTTPDQIKSGSVKPMQSTKFATYEDIYANVMPILERHGFSMWDSSDPITPGRVRLVTTLAYGGHEEKSAYDMPLDTSGSKNDVQGQGSSTSYAKRYNMINLLKIVTKGEDNDGASVIDQTTVELIDQTQLDKLVELCEDNGPNRAKLSEHLGVENLSQLPRKRFNEAVKAIESWKKARDEREKAKASPKQQPRA